MTDLVPAAGLRWLVVAHPKLLLADQDFARGLDQLFPTPRLDAFARASGVELRALASACVAGFDIGTLYLAETPSGIGIAQQAFVDRLVSDPVIKYPGPGVTHITGIIGTTPESFVALDGFGLGVAVKDPLLSKIAAAFALGKLKKSPSALDGAALRELPAEASRAPLRFYAPGPFGEPWASGAEGLLGRTLAVAIAATPEQRDRLRIEAILAGEYLEDLGAENERARRSVERFETSALGRLLGMSTESALKEVIVERTRIVVRMSLSTSRVFAGLHAAVAADAKEMLELRSRAQSDRIPPLSLPATTH
ncbi:MAG: hypothetical protein QM784_06340 [Polyangiaceae bacterium]